MARSIEAAINLIKNFESFEAKPYLCPVGIPTIGYGTTRYPDGKKVTLKDPPISEAQGEEYLKAYLESDIRLLESFLLKNKINLKDNQFSALLVFAYNVGMGPIIQPGKSVFKALLSGDKNSVVEALQLYVKMKKSGVLIVAKGLKRRREAEASLYLS